MIDMQYQNCQNQKGANGSPILSSTAVMMQVLNLLKTSEKQYLTVLI